MSLQEGIRKTYGAYHWGVLLAPKKSNGSDNIAYNVSDGIRLDSETGQDLNSERDWFFRIKNKVNPLDSGRLIGRVMIGKVPAQTTDDVLENILRLRCRIKNQEKGVVLGSGMPYPLYKMHR